MTPEARATPAWFDELITRAVRADGQPPFSDQSLIELADGRRELRAIDQAAAAVVLHGEPAELELVVDPVQRRRGLGGRLVRDIVAEHPHLLAWAHGDHAGAQVLAHRTGFAPVRRLLQLRAPIEPPIETNDTAADEGFTAFRPGVDDDDWLALNAAAFAGHPEQGSLTQADLDARMAEPWFDPHDLMLLRDAQGLAAFCWLKVEHGIGEFYVVGVDPSRQGSGLGRRLVRAGLTRLASRGIRTAALYVDADNVAAVRLYRSFGFGDHTVDVQYRRTP